MSLHARGIFVALLAVQYALHAAAVKDHGQLSPARIVVISVPAASHWFQFKAIIDELLDRGHSVQVVLTEEVVQKYAQDLQTHPNVTIDTYEVSLDESGLRRKGKIANRETTIESVKDVFGMPWHSHVILQDQELQRRIKEFAPDLVLADYVLVGGSALADKLNIPKAVVGIPGLMQPIMSYDFGSGSHLLATSPQWQMLHSRNMSFLRRLQNLGVFLADMFVWSNVIQRHMAENIWQKHGIAPYSMLQSYRNACLALISSDWALVNPEPLAPHIVLMGAITAKPPKPLPADLEQFVQSAGTHGVVFASLGTTAIPDLAELREIAKGLSAIAPTKVIWKLAESDLQDTGNSSFPVGGNVRIVKWAPQNDVLGHAHVKAFFTQGGTNSFNEAGYHGVPVVGMPLFGEQPDNIMRAVDRGFALSVSVQKPKTLAADLEKALKRVLHEPSFAVNAAKVSRQMRSRRWSPAEIAASAIEHAVWTQGEKHLQPWRHDLTWFQMMSFDVVLAAAGILTLVLSVLLTLVTLTVRAGFRFWSQRAGSATKSAKKAV